MKDKDFERLGEWYSDRFSLYYSPELAQYLKDHLLKTMPEEVSSHPEIGKTARYMINSMVERDFQIRLYKEIFPSICDFADRALKGEPVFDGKTINDLPEQFRDEYLKPLLNFSPFRNFFHKINLMAKERDLSNSDIDRIFIEEFGDSDGYFVALEESVTMFNATACFESRNLNGSDKEVMKRYFDWISTESKVINREISRSVFGDLEKKVC